MTYVKFLQSVMDKFEGDEDYVFKNGTSITGLTKTQREELDDAVIEAAYEMLKEFSIERINLNSAMVARHTV